MEENFAVQAAHILQTDSLRRFIESKGREIEILLAPPDWVNIGGIPFHARKCTLITNATRAELKEWGKPLQFVVRQTRKQGVRRH
jgi:hypothetical protein